MTYDLPPDLLHRDLVLGFFWKFSVFECALKREGFLHTGNYDVAQPDWRRFGKSIAGRFYPEPIAGFGVAVDRLKNLSPRRQVATNGQLGWRKVSQAPDQSEEEYVLELVKTVRNNLFHGGKYPDGPIEEVARNREILEAAASVLRGCYELHEGVRRWIDQAA